MSFFLAAGKTAPKLLNDILLYDPQNQKAGFNSLVDIPRYEEGKWSIDPIPPRNSCRHKWILDEDHTVLQSLNPETGRPTEYWVTAYCCICRGQLSVSLTLPSDPASKPCPSSESPLHHFISPDHFSASIATVQGSAQLGEPGGVQEFICTLPPCSAKLLVVFRPSKLIPSWVKLLTDPHLIRARAERAIASDPERFEGHSIPTGVEVLSNLRQYLLNGMRSDESKVINGLNKRWLLSLGEPCMEVLAYLGFMKKVPHVAVLCCQTLITRLGGRLDVPSTWTSDRSDFDRVSTQ